MNEDFELPVEYKGEHLLFKSSLLLIGYTYKLKVEVNGQIIMFEPDEERNYRAVIDHEDLENDRCIDVVLLKSIAQSIEKILK